MVNSLKSLIVGAFFLGSSAAQATDFAYHAASPELGAGSSILLAAQTILTSGAWIGLLIAAGSVVAVRSLFHWIMRKSPFLSAGFYAGLFAFGVGMAFGGVWAASAAVGRQIYPYAMSYIDPAEVPVIETLHGVLQFSALIALGAGIAGIASWHARNRDLVICEDTAA